jgi:hypothetical protein
MTDQAVVDPPLPARWRLPYAFIVATTQILLDVRADCLATMADTDPLPDQVERAPRVKGFCRCGVSLDQKKAGCKNCRMRHHMREKRAATRNGDGS